MARNPARLQAILLAPVLRIDHQLIVRQRNQSVQAVERTAEGQGGAINKVVSYERRSVVTGQKHDAADVSVFDMNGNRLADKTWREKLKVDRHALIAYDGRLPLPRELQLFKDDVLLVVLPAHAIPPPAPPTGYAPAMVRSPETATSPHAPTTTPPTIAIVTSRPQQPSTDGPGRGRV